MYWFSSPPYLRYTAALLLVLAALWVELRPRDMVEHPFALQSVPAGTPLEPSMFEFRDVPPGVLEAIAVGGAARHAIAAGQPLLPGDTDPTGVVVPTGWWTVEVPLPAATQPGDEVRLVVRPLDIGAESVIVDGLAVRTPIPEADPFGLEPTAGLVAIPGAQAADVALAAGDHRLTVLVRKPDEVGHDG